jgi:outer membrane protein insertion porin family
MRIFVFLIIIISGITACKVNQYPTTGNYAYKTIVNVEGDYDETEKKVLKASLERQIDDSLLVSKVKKKTTGLLGFIKHTVKVYHNFDSNHISRTQDFFKASYIANGYFRGGETTYDIKQYVSKKKNGIFSFLTNPSKNKKAQLKNAQIITFNCYPFKNHKMDSIATLLRDTSLQKLANSVSNATVLKKNGLYTQDLMDYERRRLTAHFKNNGYLFFSKEDLKVVVDTINTALLKYPSDPIEELQLLEKASAFEKNPTTGITLLLNDTIAPNKLKQYYIGKVYIQPDNLDGQITPPNSYAFNNNKFIKQFYVNNFNDKLFETHIFLNEGDLYNEFNIEKTKLFLNSLNVWQQLTVRPLEKSIRADTIDFIINMKPAATFQREFKVEGTFNQNNNLAGISIDAKQLYGLNTYVNFKNRNFKKKAIQTNLTGNFSVEFGKNRLSNQNLINTLQTGLNFNFLFPKLTLLNQLNNNPNIKNARSGINANASYSNRISTFSLTEFGAGYTSAFKLINKTQPWDIQVSVATAELKFLNASTAFQTILDNTQSLRNIYRDGFVFSALNETAIKTKTLKENNILQTSTKTYSRYNTEISVPFLRNTLKDKVFSFYKLELDKRFYFNRPKSRTWALRFFAGRGFNYKASYGQVKTLPFFKQYVAGGPNSLRAWNIRSVSSYSTRKSNDTINESFGDIQVEINTEYRYSLGQILGFKVQGALFADMGNIWNHKPIDPLVYPTNLSKAQIIIDDIAIAVGTGFRIDFDYFLIRFDLATKFKDPKTIIGGGGVLIKENYSQLKDIKFQLGINLPF